MKRNYRRRSFQPLARAITIIASLCILVTGVTFAALQSQQAILAGNTIQTATADLKIGLSPNSFSNSQSGFSFADIVPGAAAAPDTGTTFYLKNFGTPALALKIAVSTTPTNLQNVDLSKVYVILTRTDGSSSAAQKLSLSSLITSYVSGGTALTNQLNGGATATYTMQVQMDADAFTGSSADIGGIDFVFDGSAVTN